MIVWLDQKIFGNGYGIKSPHWDDVYYWLSGELYTWIGGFGAQLCSFQWAHPKPGEERILAGRRFKPYFSTRRWLWLFRGSVFQIPLPMCRVQVSWEIDMPDGIDNMNNEIHKLKKDIQGGG